MSDPEEHLESLVSNLIGRHDPRHTADFSFDWFDVRVLTNRIEIAEQLGEYFQCFRSRPSADPTLIHFLDAAPIQLEGRFLPEPPGTGKCIVKNEYRDIPGGRIVRKPSNGMHFLFGGDRHCAIGPCLSRFSQLVQFINTRYMDCWLSAGSALCHASGVALGDCGLAISGYSGAGKSTLALHLVSAGADYVSNDRLILTPSSVGIGMHGVPKYPRVNPGTIFGNPNLASLLTAGQRAEFERMGAEQLWNWEQKFDARVDRLFGPRRVRLSSPFSGLVLLNWVRSFARLCIRRTHPSMIPGFRERVLKQTGVFHLGWPADRDAEHAEVLSDLWTGADVALVDGGGEFGPLVEACWEFLQSGRWKETEHPIES